VRQHGFLHLFVAEGVDVTLHLLVELVVVHTARGVDEQHQFEINVLGGGQGGGRQGAGDDGGSGG